jgi:hypothetical protein
MCPDRKNNDRLTLVAVTMLSIHCSATMATCSDMQCLIHNTKMRLGCDSDVRGLGWSEIVSTTGVGREICSARRYRRWRREQVQTMCEQVVLNKARVIVSSIRRGRGWRATGWNTCGSENGDAGLGAGILRLHVVHVCTVILALVVVLGKAA